MTHGDLGLDSVVWGFSLDDTWLPPLAFGSFFFFSFFSFRFFFFSVTWSLALPDSSSEEEGGEGETDEVEGLGVTLVSSSCWLDYSGITVFWMTEVEKSQTGKPIVNPGSDNVVIWGAPTSPQEEKGLGFPPKGNPWLVDSIFLNLKTNEGTCDVIPIKINFRRFDTTCFFNF